MESISVKQAAVILGVSEFTVRTYIKKGLLKSERKPKGLKFEYILNKSEVAALKASSTNK